MDDPVHSGNVIVRFCVVTPVSIRATIVSDVAPALMAHAFGMSIDVKFHCVLEKWVSFGRAEYAIVRARPDRCTGRRLMWFGCAYSTSGCAASCAATASESGSDRSMR